MTANDPLLSFVPRWPTSAAGISGRYLTPDSVRQRDKVELPCQRSFASASNRRPIAVTHIVMDDPQITKVAVNFED